MLQILSQKIIPYIWHFGKDFNFGYPEERGYSLKNKFPCSVAP